MDKPEASSGGADLLDLRGADLEDLGATDRTHALRRGPPVLHGDLLRVLYLARGLALDAIAASQRSTSR